MFDSQLNISVFKKLTFPKTGLSYCHMLIITIFRSKCMNLPSKYLTYRSFKNVNGKKFLLKRGQHSI